MKTKPKTGLDLYDYAMMRAMKAALTHPLKKFSILDLAKEAKLAPSAAKYALDYMLVNGLVTDEKVSRIHQYRANTGNYLTRQWKIFFSLEEITNAKIVSNILKQSESISSVLLYGSTASGTDDDLSDIDLLVIADVDLEKRRGIVTQAHGTVREPNIIVYTPQEWRKKAEKDKAFYDNAIINSIVLYGRKPVVL